MNQEYFTGDPHNHDEDLLLFTPGRYPQPISPLQKLLYELSSVEFKYVTTPFKYGPYEIWPKTN